MFVFVLFFFEGGGALSGPLHWSFHTKYFSKMSKLVLYLNLWSVTCKHILSKHSTPYTNSPIWKQLMCHGVVICIALVSHIYLTELSDWSILVLCHISSDKHACLPAARSCTYLLIASCIQADAYIQWGCSSKCRASDSKSGDDYECGFNSQLV